MSVEINDNQPFTDLWIVQPDPTKIEAGLARYRAYALWLNDGNVDDDDWDACVAVTDRLTEGQADPEAEATVVFAGRIGCITIEDQSEAIYLAGVMADQTGIPVVILEWPGYGFRLYRPDVVPR